VITGLKEPSGDDYRDAVTELVRLLNSNFTFVCVLNRESRSNSTLNFILRAGIFGRVTLTIGG